MNLKIFVNFCHVLRYNYLNLPATISFENGDQIKYLYNAAGQKLRQEHYERGTLSSTTDYVGSFVFENQVLDYVLTGEGKISHIMEPARENSLYEYFLSDHLGNVRAVIADENDDGVPELLSNSFYYPFGLTLPLKTSTSTENKYLYNGKVIQNESGLNWFDYGARMYDPAIGRWHVPDPLTEKAGSWTPYRYAFNNPINIIDPNGMLESEIADIGAGAYNWVQHYVIDLDDVYITAETESDAVEATKAIDEASDLNITRDENGKLHADGESKKAGDKVLLEAINSETRDIKIEIVDGHVYTSKDGNEYNLPEHGFDGSVVIDGKTIATTYINWLSTKNLAKVIGEKPGETMIHEIKEGYWGAKKYPGGDNISIAYYYAHRKASRTDRVPVYGIDFNYTRTSPGYITIQARRTEDTQGKFQYINRIPEKK